MKLTFTKNLSESKILTEANLSKGMRIDLGQKIIEKIKSGPKTLGLDISDAKHPDLGFYIIPKRLKYITKVDIKFDSESGSPAFQITPFGIDGTYSNFPKVNGVSDYDVPVDVNTFAETVASSLVDTVCSYIPSTKTLLETKLSNFINKLAAHRQAKKDSKDVLKDLQSELSTLIDAKLSELSSGKNDVKVEYKIKDSTLSISFICKYLIGVGYSVNPANQKNVIVSKIITPLGDIDIKNNANFKSLQDVLDTIGKKLNIAFPKLDDSLNSRTAKDSTSSSSGESENPNSETETGETETSDVENPNPDESNNPNASYDQNIINSFPEDVRKIFTEKFEVKKLSESKLVLKSKGKAKNYQEAAPKLDDNQFLNLVKLFIFKETGLEDKDISDNPEATISEIADVAKQAGGFEVKTNNNLAAILHFLIRNKKLPESFIKTITRNSLKNIIKDHVDDIDKKDVQGNTTTFSKSLDKSFRVNIPLALFYIKELFNQQLTPDKISKIINLWYDERISLSAIKELDSNAVGQTVAEILGIEVNDQNKDKIEKFASDANKVKKLIFVNETSKKFRSPSDIEKFIEKLTGKAGESNSESDTQDSDEGTNDNTEVTLETLTADVNDGKLVDQKELFDQIEKLGLSEDKIKSLQKAIIAELTK